MHVKNSLVCNKSRNIHIIFYSFNSYFIVTCIHGNQYYNYIHLELIPCGLSGQPIFDGRYFFENTKLSQKECIFELGLVTLFYAVKISRNYFSPWKRLVGSYVHSLLISDKSLNTFHF